MTFSMNVTTHPWFEGRVYPSSCNVWYAHLLFANDDGIFLYRPHVPTKPVEIETQEDMQVIFKAFKEGVIQLTDKPMRVTDDLPITLKPQNVGKEFMFQPGVTTFFVLVDVTVQMINLYQLVQFHGIQIIDEEAGRPAGIQKWIDNGYLGEKKLPLRVVEVGRLLSCNAHGYMIHQNLNLCTAAMGLGGNVTAGGYISLMLMNDTLAKSGRGFRFAVDKSDNSYPVGIDGIIETHCPPYMSMDDAVEDVWAMKFKPGYGRYSPEIKEGNKVIYRGFDPEPREVYRPFKNAEKYNVAATPKSSEGLQIAKDIANYIYDTYGRFPKLYNPIVCEHVTQVQHIDTDFYDQYLLDGSTWQEQREHLRIWHQQSE